MFLLLIAALVTTSRDSIALLLSARTDRSRFRTLEERSSFRGENPGKAVGPNNSYVTSTSAGAPQWVLWVSQLNITYSPLTNISTSNDLNYGQTIQPDVSTYVSCIFIVERFMNLY